MNPAQKTLVQYLEEARATERALVRVLQSQIAMTPRGSYRSGLESHLDETREHAARVDARLKALDQGSNPLMAVVGLAESVLGQALAIGKAPFDLLRGSGGEEKVLKNAKDACATESLEIATYTAIERLARSVGDEETEKLAASIRADEERMLQFVLREIPKLTEAVVRADVRDAFEGDLAIPRYDTLTAGQINGRLSGLSQVDLAKIDSYERRNRNRTTVLSRIDSLRGNTSQAAGGAAGANGAGAVSDEQDLRASAESGDSRAAFELGMLLWERRDVDAAEGMLRRASVDTQGAHAFGLLLWRERGNPDAAVEWLDRAARADDPAAERDLGILLQERGDLHGAHHWLSRAAERDSEARQVLAELG
jgi:ferritin-like metal-binding protein YciE